MKLIKIIGGLGNQMCQYAFGESLRLHTGDEIKYDITGFENYNLHNGFELEKVFDLQISKASYRDILKTKKIYYKIGNKNLSLDRIEKKIFGKNIFIKSKLIIDNVSESNKPFCNDYLFNYPNSYYMGLFHSYLYYKPFEEKIKNLFRFKKINDRNNLEIISLIKKTHSISIHVRRGDYLEEKNSSLNIINDNYYRRAINFIENKILNPIYFVFSNDIDWCKNNFSYLKNVYFIDWNKNEDSYKDMYLMSLCKHNIIVNSTFSWWAAYLNSNPNKIVITPKIWKKNVLNTEDRCPKEWIRI